MKNKYPPLKSLIATLWLVLAFLGLSTAMLQAEWVVCGVTSVTTTMAAINIPGGSSGGWSGIANASSTVAATATQPGGLGSGGGVGMRYCNKNDGAPAVLPWIELQPTLAKPYGNLSKVYKVYGTRGTGTTGNGADWAISQTGCDAASATTTPFFRSSQNAAAQNKWAEICAIAVSDNQTAPTVRFTATANSYSRTYADSFYFTNEVAAKVASIGGINQGATSILVGGVAVGANGVYIFDLTVAPTPTDWSACIGTNTSASAGGAITVSGMDGNLVVVGHQLTAVQDVQVAGLSGYAVLSPFETAPLVTVTTSTGVGDIGGFVVPVYSDAASVTVTNVDPTATEVKIYHDTDLIGSTTTIPGTTVTVGVSALTKNWILHATQVVGGVESSSGSAPITVVQGDICTSVANVSGYTTPVYDTHTSVTVNGCSTAPPAATIKVYHDVSGVGTLLGSAAGGAATVTVNVSALTAGWVLKATQVIGAQESCYTNAPSVTVLPICASIANVGGYTGPFIAGQSSVIVTGCDPTATAIKVYQGTTLKGTAAGGAATVTVPCTGLAAGTVVKATQTIGGQESCLTTGAPSSAKVGSGAPKALRFALIFRNTGTANSPLGSDGGTSGGTIYMLGASSGSIDNTIPPAGIPARNIVAAGSGWQTLTFTNGNANECCQIYPTRQAEASIPGSNGNWDSLVSLAVMPDTTGDSGPYEIWVDNFENVGEPTSPSGMPAGVLQTWESGTVGSQLQFRQPSYSGWTGGNILAGCLNTSQVATPGDASAKSDRITWQWDNNTATFWQNIQADLGGIGASINLDPTKSISLRVKVYSPTITATRTSSSTMQLIWSSNWGVVTNQSLTGAAPWGALSGPSPLTAPIAPAGPTYFRLSK